MSKIRILIADDHSLMRTGLASLIAITRDMETVGEAENGKQAVELVRRLKPDIVVMDLMMPELNGSEATKLIHDEFPEVKIVILTSFGSSVEMSRAIANGADGALMKDTATADFIKTLRAVAAGKTVIPEYLLQMAKADASALKLTDHQREMLAYMVKGVSYTEIAQIFSVTEITVKKTMQTIFAKIGAANRSEAIAITFQRHLLKDED